MFNQEMLKKDDEMKRKTRKKRSQEKKYIFIIIKGTRNDEEGKKDIVKDGIVLFYSFYAKLFYIEFHQPCYA